MVRCSPGLEVDIINYFDPGPHQNVSEYIGSLVPVETGITPCPEGWAGGGSSRPSQAVEGTVRATCTARRWENRSPAQGVVAIGQESKSKTPGPGVWEWPALWRALFAGQGGWCNYKAVRLFRYVGVLCRESSEGDC